MLSTNAQKLIVENSTLATKIAKYMYCKYKCKDINTLRELESVANLGLIDAATKFNTSKNTKFTTYASIRIHGQIKDYWRKEGKSKGFKRNAKKMTRIATVLSMEDVGDAANELANVDVLNKIVARDELANLLKQMRKIDKKAAYVFWQWAFKNKTYKQISLETNINEINISKKLCKLTKELNLNKPQEIKSKLKQLTY